MENETWKRLVLFPIQYDKIWTLYKNAQASFWTAEEIDFSKDRVSWKSMKYGEQQLVLTVLSFFAAADGLVMENIAENFFQEVDIPEARAFYSFQIYIENIHSEVYSLAIDSYVQDKNTKDKILKAVVLDPAVKLKAEWTLQYIRNKSLPFCERLVAFAAVEMIFFCGAFSVLFWLKSRSLLPALTFSNDLISRDESLHVLFACELFKELPEKCSEKKIRKIILSATCIEKEFWKTKFSSAEIGINSDAMGLYVQSIADKLLDMFHLEPEFQTSNPFPFADNISLESKSNFFERKVAEYRLSKIGDQTTFTLDADF